MKDEEIYNIWIDNIVKRFKKGDWGGETGLYNHILHGIESLYTQKINSKNLSTVECFLDIAKKLHGFEIPQNAKEYKDIDDTDFFRSLMEKAFIIKGSITFDWLVSIISLVEIIKTKYNVEIDNRSKLERLYLNWKADELNAEPPPFEELFLDKKK